MAKPNKRLPPPPPNLAEEEIPELVPDMIPDLDGTPEAEEEEIPPAELPKPVAKKKIQVKAIGPGFIHSERKAASHDPKDYFHVREHELGKWMECIDPIEQRKHLARQEAKRRRINAEAVKFDKEDRAAVE